MMEFLTLIILPILVGVILFLIPEKIRLIKGIIATLIGVVCLYYAWMIFKMPSGIVNLNLPGLVFLDNYLILNLDALAKLILLFAGFFGFLFLVYSLSYFHKGTELRGFYSYYLITLGSAFAVLLTDHFASFLFFWGILGITLYKMVRGDKETNSSVAKKSLILIGASDSILILGVGLIWKMSGTLRISEIGIEAMSAIGVISFLALLIASLTKAGAFPFHTWIPGFAQEAPANSSALLIASLDKLLGIYFLARLCLDIFAFQEWIKLVLLIIGSITIIAAVMMALIQHNFKKLLGYHAVSQVGYMITGIGLGSALGIAGGLFHMINHTVYKSGLFLSAGSVEKRTGETELENLGGLSRLMPITFFSTLICALSISGVPPFNGFASKWMIYQGIIDFGTKSGIASKLWIIWLIMAVFGSALTLASFVKFISGTFLGRRNTRFDKIREVSPLMWLPQIILALICIGFGIFASTQIVPHLFEPVSGSFDYTGLWNSPVVSILIIVSIIFGIIIYLIGNNKNMRKMDSFVGGEQLQEEMNYSVLDFYKTVSSNKLLSFFYRKAEKKSFDIYHLSKGIVLWFNRIFSRAHSGMLPTYLIWMIGGMIILLLIIM